MLRCLLQRLMISRSCANADAASKCVAGTGAGRADAVSFRKSSHIQLVPPFQSHSHANVTFDDILELVIILFRRQEQVFHPDLSRFSDQRTAVDEPPALSLALPGPHPALSRRESWLGR
jgi:hypothetical protein